MCNNPYSQRNEGLLMKEKTLEIEIHALLNKHDISLSELSRLADIEVARLK